VTVILFDYRCLLYDFFFADIVVIQSASTSLVESLVVNPKTVQAQMVDHHDFMELKKYDLLRADSQNELKQMVESLLTNPESIITDTYEQNVQKYLNYQLGEGHEQSCTQQIIDKVRQQIQI
jgi:hypothetical protein